MTSEDATARVEHGTEEHDDEDDDDDEEEDDDDDDDVEMMAAAAIAAAAAAAKPSAVAVEDGAATSSASTAPTAKPAPATATAGNDGPNASEGDGEEGVAGAGEGEGHKRKLMRPAEASADPLLIREYCRQLVTPEVQEACGALLSELQRLQERAHLKDAVKAAMKKRYVCGLREVHRALQRDKAKVLVVAHNIERIEAEHGLDDLMAQIMQLCDQRLEWVYDDTVKASKQMLVPREQPVPIVFAFTRRLLSRALKRSAKTSCVAVLSHDGAGELFHTLMKEAQVAKQQFAALSVYHPHDATRCRRLIVRHVKALQKSVATDELLLHALATQADYDEA